MKRLVPEIVLEHYRQRRSIGRFRAVAMSVDISGFTGLAESLMRHRQTGAEVITQVLNQVLSPLIRKVYALGGFVASFAGDSLTALFPLSEGVDASRHCVKIARFARDRSTENGTVRTPSGAFDIGVRIGLSQGQVKLSILGTGTKHAYHFRGSGIESCAQALARAGKGEVLVTGDFRNSLSSWIKTVPVNGFHRIVDCDSEEHIPREIIQALYQGSPPSEEELGHFALDRVLDLVKSGASAELRSVTATFIDFEDKMDDADLNRFVSSVLELAEEYGGYVNKLLFGEKGASILVLFGAPRTLENDCARTADFLLALKQKEPLVPWNAGSAFGMVYAGLIGCEERCEYTSIGDIVNLAARIAQQKNWGEFRMNRELAERLQGTHDLQLVDSFSFKGKLTLQPIYRLTGRRSLGDSSFFSGHIVGRKGELATLQDWIAPALNGGFAGIMYICGDPGIGKSRLAEEFHQRITSMPGNAEANSGDEPGREVQWFQCPADEILRKSLNPFRHFLRRYFDQRQDLSQEENLARFKLVLKNLTDSLASSDKHSVNDCRDDDIASELTRTRSFLGALVDLHWPDSLYSRLEPKLRFPNTMLALKTLFKAESLRNPVVLLMEDIQWLDTDSVELLRLLTRNVEKYPMAVICTARYEDDGSHVMLQVDEEVPQQKIELRPLENGSVRALVRQLLGADASEELIAFILEKTASNPFFVEQLLLDLRERGVLKLEPADRHEEDESGEAADNGKWMLDRTGPEIPTGISAVLLARLDRLAARVRQTVQTASVLGREFPVQVLSRMLKDDELLFQNVKQAESARIWTAVSELRYMFRHALLRDAAYQMQLRSRLQALHRMAAEAMEQVYEDDLSPRYSELAYHFGQADVSERERFYAELAGGQAADTFANQEALTYLGRALELTPGGNARFKLLSTRERVYDLLGMRSEQLDELESMKSLADSLNDPELMAKAILRRAQYAADTSDYPVAIESARHCITLARKERPSPELMATGVKARNVWGISLMSQGSFDQAGEKLEQTLELAEKIEDRGQQVTVLGNLGMLHALQGRFDQARTFWNRGLRICREVDDLLHETAILLNLGNVAFSLCDLTLAERNWEKALSIFKKIGYRTGAAHALLNLGVLSYQLGGYSTAKFRYEQALSIARETGDRQIEGMALGNLGNVLTQLGEYSDAGMQFLEALTLRRSIGDQQGQGIVLGYLCHLEMLCGRYETAEEYGRESLRISREIGDRPYQAKTLTYLGHALAAQDRLDEACADYGEALSLYRELGQQGLTSESLAGLAQAAMKRGRLEEAMRFVEEILDFLEGNSLDSTEAPFSVYLTCYDILKALGDIRGEEILNAALSQLRERADRIQDESLRHSYLGNVAVNRRIIELAQD